MKKLILVVSILALSACSDDTASNSATNNSNGNNGGANPFLTADVSGAAQGSFSGNGSFYCTDDGLGAGPVAEITATGTDGQQVQIYLRYEDGGVGTNVLIGRDENPSTGVDRLPDISYRAADNTSYDYGTGTATFTTWPTEPGGAIEGTFNASLRAEADEGSAAVQISNGVISGTSLTMDWDCL